MSQADRSSVLCEMYNDKFYSVIKALQELSCC